MNYSREIIKISGILIAIVFSIQSNADNTNKIAGNSPKSFTVGGISLGNEIAEVKAREIVLINGEIIPIASNENIDIGDASRFCRNPHQEQVNKFEKKYPKVSISKINMSDFYKLRYKIISLNKPYWDVYILLNPNNKVIAISAKKDYSHVAEGVVIDAIFDLFGEPKYVYKQRNTTKSLIFTDINITKDKLSDVYGFTLFQDMNHLLNLMNSYSNIDYDDNITPLKGNYFLAVSSNKFNSDGVVFFAIKDYQTIFDDLRILRQKCVVEYKNRLDKLEEDTAKNTKPFDL
jgi:hypothetical protein